MFAHIEGFSRPYGTVLRLSSVLYSAFLLWKADINWYYTLIIQQYNYGNRISDSTSQDVPATNVNRHKTAVKFMNVPSEAKGNII